MFGLKTCDFPAKNASSSKVTANHTKRGRRVRKCVCAHACVCDYRKFTECKTEIYKAKPVESIISYITTQMDQITICTLNAMQPMCCLRLWAFIYFGCLWVNIWLGLGQFPNLQRRSKCLNSQWKEVGREEREKWGELRDKGKDEWKERVNDRAVSKLFTCTIRAVKCCIMMMMIHKEYG